MTITIISDCYDENAKGRQQTRISSLLKYPVNFIGVSNELEAAGNLIDTLDAIEDRPGIVLINIAPRHNKIKKWKNGTPFGYFFHQKTLVITTIDGLTLSLIKKLKLLDYVRIINIPTILEEMINQEYLSKELKDHITNTQFRSYEFVPRIINYFLKNEDVPSINFDINEIPSAPHAVWWIDNFGNCKTTILPEDIPWKLRDSVTTKIGELNYFPRLKDVVGKRPALVVSSSGIGDKRFLEIVIQGGNAAEYLNLSVGDVIL